MKRILALLTIIILVSLYIITLIAAIAGTPTSNTLFMGSLIASIILPVILFAIFHTYDLLKSISEKMAQRTQDMNASKDDSSGNTTE